MRPPREAHYVRNLLRRPDKPSEGSGRVQRAQLAVVLHARDVIARIADGAQDAAVFGVGRGGLAFGRGTQDATTWPLDNRAATILLVSRPARQAKWL
jgi:hypothetical protein